MKKYKILAAAFEKVQTIGKDDINVDEMILFEGAKKVVLSSEFPSIYMATKDYEPLRNSSSDGAKLCRKLLSHFFDEKTLASQNRASLESANPDLMTAIYRNSCVKSLTFFCAGL